MLQVSLPLFSNQINLRKIRPIESRDQEIEPVATYVDYEEEDLDVIEFEIDDNINPDDYKQEAWVIWANKIVSPLFALYNWLNAKISVQ
jgi:hypothetical protein